MALNKRKGAPVDKAPPVVLPPRSLAAIRTDVDRVLAETEAEKELIAQEVEKRRVATVLAATSRVGVHKRISDEAVAALDKSSAVFEEERARVYAREKASNAPVEEKLLGEVEAIRREAAERVEEAEMRAEERLAVLRAEEESLSVKVGR